MRGMAMKLGVCAALTMSAGLVGAAPGVDEVLAQYGRIVHAGYADTLTGARALQQAVEAFVAAPSEAGLLKARQAWRAGREWYGQTEAFRFYGGPIDGKDGPEGYLNAWPMDEAYVDGVAGNPASGIINNPKIRLDAKTLRALNEKDGEENIATGWHAIEFLLWGQDQDVAGPGQRAHTDFVDGQAPNAERRRAYLKLVTDLLVKDLASLERAWAPGAKNYRASFEKDPANLVKLFSALGILSRGELAGERIEVALDSQNQEDEHSCFSDNTHRDIVANAVGIRNVWRGEYVRLDGSRLAGASLRDLVAASDPAAAGKAEALIEASVQAAEAIPAPFDQAILAGHPGREKVEATVTALKAQTEALVVAAQAIGIKRLNTALPD